MDLVTIVQTVNQALAAAEVTTEATTAAVASYVPLGAGIAAGFAVLGVGIGVGKLVSSALEGAARQPEMAGKLQTMMILGIAFIEALALIALVVTPFLLKLVK